MKHLLPLAAVCFGVSLTACDKDDVTDTAAPTAEDQAAARLAVAQAVSASAGFSAAFATVSEAAQTNDGLSGDGLVGDAPAPELRARNCAAPAFATTPQTFFPATVTLDFGDGCTDDQGRALGGTLVATFSGLFHEPGTRIDLRLDRYLVAGNRLTGDYAITNTGPDAQGRPTFRHSITGGTVDYPDGTSLGYEEVVTSVVAEGADTDFWNAGVDGLLDDVHEDTRTATVRTAAGNVIGVRTTQPLRRPVTCPRPVSGRYDLTTPALAQTAELDFGDGACDDRAEVRYAGEAWDVTF